MATKTTVVDKSRPTKGGSTLSKTSSTASKPVEKKSKGQAKMGHVKVTQKAPAILCDKGHPTQLVHYNKLGAIARWCPACQGVV